jgi:hypothetical protein
LSFFLLSSSLNFAWPLTGKSTGHTMNSPYTDPAQLSLPMLMRLDGPSILPPQRLLSVGTYRQAVAMCWALRRDHGDGAQSACARFIGAQVSHMSAYLSDDPEKRDMPAKFVRAFEVWCGNTAVTQFLARGSKLTVAEEFQARALA